MDELEIESTHMLLKFRHEKNTGEVFILTEDDEHLHTMHLLPLDIANLKAFVNALP